MWSHVKAYMTGLMGNRPGLSTMSSGTDIQTETDSGAIERLALGSVAELGWLYDARRDQFCGLSILNQQPPAAAVKTTEIHSSESKFIHVNNTSDKYNKLCISTEQSLSVLTGLASVKGSWGYLNYLIEKYSAREVEATLFYKSTTVKEELLIFSDELKKCVQMNELQHKDATHVVVGIEWGADLMITAEHNNKDNRDAVQIGRLIEAKLKKFAKGLIDVGGEGEPSEESDETMKFSFNIHGYDLRMEGIPRKTDDMPDFIAYLATRALKANTGKGQPLQYTLLPLSKIRSYYNINPTAPPVLRKLSEESILRVFSVFDVVTEAWQKLHDLNTDVSRFKCCLPDNLVRETLQELDIPLGTSESQFRGSLRNLLIQVRSGLSEPHELEKLIEDYEKQPYSAPNVIALISHKYGSVLSKIEDLRRLKRAGVILVPKSVLSLESEMSRYGAQNCFILFRDCKAEGNEVELWNMHLLVHESMAEKSKVINVDGVFLYVDLETAPHLAPQGIQKTVIQHFRGGKLWTPDVVLSTIRSIDHEEVGRLSPLKQLNILVLGESGAGKSTWINGILNYMTHETLEQAERGKLLYAIPMSFTTTDDDYNQVKITVGEDAKKNPDTTASATQYPKSYVFSAGDKLVRLIDTPGIGDTKGIDQDKVSFQRILDHLSYMHEIHGICILLKPNDARLTVVFRFCIKELITHLNPDASKNIVFCFTNARSTLYRPGETLTSLKALLTEMKEKHAVDIAINQHTVYPMDNEAIRFLAALKQGITFDKAERANFAASWEKSVAETARLFAHIENLPPHVTESTLSLNKVRRMIMELTRPLAEIGKNIRDNICLMKDKEEEISRIDIKTADLRKVLKIPFIRLNPIQLEHPRTVCASPKCVKKVRGTHNVYHNTYSQICHEICHFYGIPIESINWHELQRCDAMDDKGEQSSCKHCGCSWLTHMHHNYVIEVVDDCIQSNLGQGKGAKAQAEAVKAALAQAIKKLEEEEEIIIKVSAKFAVFLKENAMTAYNDATADYLDHLIAVEKAHVSLGNGKQVLDALQRRKAAHEQEKRALEDRLASAGGAEEISLRKIYEEINTLRNLPQSGSTVQNMMREVKKANKALSYAEILINKT